MSDHDASTATADPSNPVRRISRGRALGALSRAATAALMLQLPLVRIAAAESNAPPPAPGAAMSDAPPPAAGGATSSGEHRPSLPGQLSTKFGIDPARPEESVPNAQDRDRNPLEYGYFIQDLLERAEQAQKNKDYDAVVRYYRAVAKAVPESAKGWSKLCEAYERVRDRERAIVACRYAIDRPAVEVHDYVRYVHLILAQNGPLAPKEREEVDAVLTHLDKQNDVAVITAHLRCEVGVKVQDVAMLEACTKVLVAQAPDDPKTVVFRWTLAMMKGQSAEASRLLTDARATGVPAESVERMQAITPGSGSAARALALGIGAAVAIAAGAIVVLVLSMRRRRALATSRAVT